MTTEIAVMSKTDAARRWSEFDAVITIEDPSEADGLRLQAGCGVPQLLLKFDDVVADARGRRAASPRQIEQALAWARDWTEARLAVHCEMGVSRSAAVALAILAERLGAGCEDAAVKHLLALRPVASCNPRIVEMADELLARGGRLVDAVKRADEGRFTGGFFMPPAAGQSIAGMERPHPHPVATGPRGSGTS